MIYKKYKFLLIYSLFIILFVAVSSETILYTHLNTSAVLYDITTIYKISNTSLNVDKGFKDKHFLHKFNGSYSIKIHSRTNAIGLPIDKEINRNFPYNTFVQTNSPIFYKCGFTQNTSRMQVLYDPIDWGRRFINLSGDSCRFDNTTNRNDADKCYNIFDYRYDIKHRNTHDVQTQKIFSIQWTPEKQQTCLAITYIYLPISRGRFLITVSGENKTTITSSSMQKFDDTKTLKLTDMNLMKDKKYELSFEVTMDVGYYNHNSMRGRTQGRGMGYFGIWFGIMRIADCSNIEEEVRIVSLNGTKKHQRPESYNVLGNGIKYKKSLSKFKCLNGGFKQSKNGTCVCPPGFIGAECETGCGPNSYGADCKGVCSMHGNKMCRGLYMCTKYGCTCPVGLTGPWCNKECTRGKYGADCALTCTQCKNNTCDPYTGACLHGCSAGYIQPNCSHKYPYLIHPPKLVSSQYDKMQLKLNFQPSNVKGGNKNIKLKYYRLFYKTSRKKKFSNSEIKPLVDEKYRPKEILSDLQPDTEYMVGVLLITDDGNLNERDIVYGRYRTSCIDPEITDFNFQITRAVKSVDITWNKITPNRLDCKIDKHFLTLSYDKSLNKTARTLKLNPKSKNSYTLKHLIPGYQYGVQLTFETTQDRLLLSPVWMTTPLIGDDIKIKQISTVFEDEKIKVAWKYGFIHEHFAAVDPDIDEPVTSILRYKIEKLLSCSLQALANNWTSITIFNRTNYEIVNTVPNSQYHIQIFIAKNNTTQQETTAFTLTPATIPITAPSFDTEHRISVTNNSIFFQWKLDPLNCSKLNGFFSKFLIELKDMSNNTLETRETKKTFIFIDGLKSNTSYELKVFIKTHVGYNSAHYLFTNFTTKIGLLMPIENLTVYMKSLENGVVGLRWSYLENSNLLGFVVSFNKDKITPKSQNVSIIFPTKCPIWSNYFCHTFVNLTAIGNFTFNITPKTVEYPDGGNVSSISFDMSDAPPDLPNNITVDFIGNTSITIKWDTPWFFNGILTHFIVTAQEITTVDMSTCCVKIPPVKIPFVEEYSSYHYTLKELKPGSTYSIGTSSVSKTLQSNPAIIHVTTAL